MPIPTSNSINSAIFGIYRLLIVFAFLFVLYFAQSIIIPLIIAALLTFFLSPLVAKLERWMGRTLSILLVVLVVFSFIGLTGYIFAKQLILFGSNFQSYYEIIQAKFQAFHFPQGGIFDRIGQIIGNFKEVLLGEYTTPNPDPKLSPVEIKLLDLTSHVTGFLQSFFGSFFNFLVLSGIILLLVIFMLFSREDIRGRIIKLAGQSRIGSTISAMNDASERVFRYLFRLFIVNIGFGICVTLGLYAIGIPNAVLWGCLAALLRFIPYIGVWMASIVPIILSFIITDSWLSPIFTISFYILLEVITAYVIEPLYYGVGTGVSSLALIVAVLFWTWLWGPIGLLLSTPLTVCLVVLGQYVPNMNFLRVLLSQEQALTPAEEYYHRLLSFDSSEPMDLIEPYLQENSLVSLYDSLLIPVVAQTEIDFYQELIDVEQKDEVYQNIREIIEFLPLSEQKEKETSSTVKSKSNILCLPLGSIRDEIGISILAQLLASEGLEVHYTTKLNVEDTLELVNKGNPEIICIVAIAPWILSKVRFLCTKLHKQKPELPIVICLFGLSEASSQIPEKLASVGATKVVFNLSQAIQTFKDLTGQVLHPNGGEIINT